MRVYDDNVECSRNVPCVSSAASTSSVVNSGCRRATMMTTMRVNHLFNRKPVQRLKMKRNNGNFCWMSCRNVSIKTNVGIVLGHSCYAVSDLSISIIFFLYILYISFISTRIYFTSFHVFVVNIHCFIEEHIQLNLKFIFFSTFLVLSFPTCFPQTHLFHAKRFQRNPMWAENSWALRIWGDPYDWVTTVYSDECCTFQREILERYTEELSIKLAKISDLK